MLLVAFVYVAVDVVYVVVVDVVYVVVDDNAYFHVKLYHQISILFSQQLHENKNT